MSWGNGQLFITEFKKKKSVDSPLFRKWSLTILTPLVGWTGLTGFQSVEGKK